MRAMRTGIANRADIVSDIASVQDPLLDFPIESPTVPVSRVMTPARTLIQPQNPTIDAPSRVVSFVLGFALASVLAWLGSLPESKVVDEAAVAPKAESVASVVASVVTPATPEPASSVPKPTAPSPAPTLAPPKPSSRVQTAARTTPQPTRANTAPPAQQRKPALSGYRGALVLSSSPDGAQVILNGTVVGKTPVVIDDLPVGSRALVVRRDGYQPWSASVRIVANQRTPVRATLKPLEPSG